VAKLLASSRSKVENASQSKSKNRKLAAREHLGTRAFEWMKQLEVLDQQLAISKELYMDLCWHLIAENRESALVEFLISEAASFMNQSWKPLFHRKDAIGYRIRRNYNLLSGLMEGHVSLSTDGTPNEALRCFSALVKVAEEHGSFDAFHWVGANTFLRRYVTKDYCAPYDEKFLEGLYKTTWNSSSL
jgi:hypothetical protein